MSDKQSGNRFTLHILLLVGLFLSAASSYVAFVILPEEWPERPRQQITMQELSEIHARHHAPAAAATIPPAEFGYTPPDWRVLIHTENHRAGAADIVITATDLDDTLLTADEFSAAIVSLPDETQKLPVNFHEEKPGVYALRGFALPREGEWAVRALIRRDSQTMMIGENLRELLAE